jgi:hypothetical protein
MTEESNISDPRFTFQDILSDSCRDLFSAYGIDVGAGGDAAGGSQLVGRIHFAGGAVAGTLTVALDRDQLKRSLPIQSERQADLEDWIRELANQLMGLVKRRLNGYGINVLLSLPVNVMPQHNAPSPQWPSRVSQFSIECKFGNGLSSLDGIMVADVELKAPDRSLS